MGAYLRGAFSEVGIIQRFTVHNYALRIVKLSWEGTILVGTTRGCVINKATIIYKVILISVHS